MSTKTPIAMTLAVDSVETLEKLLRENHLKFPDVVGAAVDAFLDASDCAGSDPCFVRLLTNKPGPDATEVALLLVAGLTAGYAQRSADSGRLNLTLIGEFNDGYARFFTTSAGQPQTVWVTELAVNLTEVAAAAADAYALGLELGKHTKTIPLPRQAMDDLQRELNAR